MAKIRKCKLSWEASASDNIIGYKLYWAKGNAVDYDSKCLKIGNVTEIALPDDVTFSDGPVMFGVTAVDRDGSESDMVTLAEPYRLHVPQAPAGLSLQPSEDFKLTGKPSRREDLQVVSESRPQASEDEDPLARAIEDENGNPPINMARFDDGEHEQ